MLSGDLQGLRASEKAALEKLLKRRSRFDEVIDLELARRAANLAQNLGMTLGLLIDREGRVSHVVVGKRGRIYLPDLGRYRLDAARLRRLRLVVFNPDGERSLVNYPVTEFVPRNVLRSRGYTQRSLISAGNRQIRSPEIARDLITDLEKLRLDLVIVIAVREDGRPGPFSMAYMRPSAAPLPQDDGDGALQRRDQEYSPGVGFFHGRDLGECDVDLAQFVEELEQFFTTKRDRHRAPMSNRAVLVGAYTTSAEEANASMAELAELCRTAGIELAAQVMQRRKALDPKTVIGKGKIEELVLQCLDLGAELLIFDRELSPGQLRSITNLTELKVLDRSMLILDIFAQRAKSSEGRLQVELAQLKYSLPRLTEKDSGLSRLTGGIGGRGPGETKLEIGRRRARDRIVDLEKRIDAVQQQRGVRRSVRQTRGVPVVAIVGYTNAGKSTLLNALTKSDVFVENKLFATLDPVSRRMRFPDQREVIFVDTVGFIRELPKELVTAFRATLEEVGEADLLLHVVDASDAAMQKQLEVVRETLESLDFSDKPRILVLNKTDLLPEPVVDQLAMITGGLPVSALDRRGFELMVEQIRESLATSFSGRDPGGFVQRTF